MGSHKNSTNSRFFAATFSVALLLLASLTVVLLAGGKLHWVTPLFLDGNRWLSVLFLSLACFVFLRGFRSPDWDAFSPLRLFYTLWFGLLALGCLQLTTAEAPFTIRFWTTVSCGLLAFYLGSLWAGRTGQKSGHIAWAHLPRHWSVDWIASRTLLVASLLCAVCLAAFVYAYVHAGVVPLLAENPNSVRFEFGINSYLSRFIVSFYIVIQLSYIGIVHLRKYKAAFLILILIAGAAITLITARFFLLLAIWTAIVLFHYGRRRMTPRVAFLAVLVAYPLGKVAVDVKRFYENPVFAQMLDKIDFPEKFRSLAPDYIYFSMTLQTLDHLTFIIPGELNYQHGWYTAYPARVFWTPRQGEGFRDRLDDLFWERSLEWSPVQAVTTTYMGVPYADFGISGVFVFSFFFGWLSKCVYDSFRRQPNFWRAFLYSQISFAIVLSMYANYLTLLEVYWNLLIMGLVHHWVSDRSKLAKGNLTGQTVLNY